jgi:tetratricopeptide (TPR) repeat protein
LHLEPESAVRHANLGNILADLKRHDEAEACYRRAIELDPNFGLAHYALATRLRLAGHMEAAVESYRKAVSLTPTQPLMWNDLGRTLRALGRFEEATAAFREALAADPDFSDAYRNLATCQQLVADERTIARLAALAARHDLSIDERVAAGFALGKVLDDAGRFDEAFTAYERTNRLYGSSRSAVGECFDASRLHSEVDEAIDRFTPAFFASVADWGSPSELPVFILGMPRSGTSLVEQIAASHSQVFGGGELRDVGDLAATLEPVFDRIWIGRNAQPRSCTGEARHAVRRLAYKHIERLRGLSRHALRVIDKMPDNVFKLHAIATLFPGARVIFCRRDPRDVCLSCYFQKFAAGQLVFSYDLVDCATRYLETHRLAEHWRQVMPLRMLDVQYETLVADLENESRRIVAFLGLEWEPACLDFHRTNRTVATASAWQVRQPLFGRAVGRWRNYEHHLAPLLDTLDAGGMP